MITNNLLKGSMFYLLRRSSDEPETVFQHAAYIQKSTLAHYPKTIGPIPLCELTHELPTALRQVPPLVWSSDEWLARCGDKEPRIGDLIICVEFEGSKKVVTGGFYTTAKASSGYTSSYNFVTWSSVAGNDYGFIYCSTRLIHPSILAHINLKLKK